MVMLLAILSPGEPATTLSSFVPKNSSILMLIHALHARGEAIPVCLMKGFHTN